MNHMMHWKTYLAFATGSLLLLSLPPYAAGAQNTVQQTGGSAYGQPLGRSSNLINGMKTSGKKRDNLGSIGKSFRRGCNSIAESATKKEGNQPSFFVGG